MNSLSVNLSKEWREQRGALGVLAIVAFGAVSISAATLSRATLQDPLVAQWIVGLTVLATVMSIGADLLARERQRGLEFLARIPHGLERAARGKLCFFALVLFAAFAYGALLWAGASFVRTGAIPVGALDNASLWLPIAVGVSLWVFAVSAWMPNSALTLPATALFLGVFAWPAVLAVLDDAIFRPTPIEGIVFIALCIAGTPVSAWASFVIGSRRGRSRARATLIGIAAAAPFFAPSWIWAGARYHAFAHASFDIRNGWVGPNEHYAFLELERSAPPGIAPDAANAYRKWSALIVDLERGEWRFAGEVDNSSFVESEWAFQHRSLLESNFDDRRTLYVWRATGPMVLLDCGTAREVVDPAGTASPTEPTPADFGLTATPKAYTIRWAGLGQSIEFYDDDKRRAEIYRDPTRSLVVERTKLLPTKDERKYFDIRVRPGRWLARDQWNWIWIDPISGATEPLTCVARKEYLGPSIDDGRLVLTTEAGVCLLDPNSGERESISITGDDTVVNGISLSGTKPWAGPLQINTPSVVVAFGHEHIGVGWLDLRARTLHVLSTGAHNPVQLMSSSGSCAITLEDNARIVRYDFERNSREVLFDIASVH